MISKIFVNLDNLLPMFVEMRKMAGMSQSELARQVNCTSHAINHYERRKRKLPLTVMAKLALLCGYEMKIVFIKIDGDK